MSDQSTNKENPAQVFSRLKDDSDYLATMDRSQLSQEDQEAYDELVSSHKAEYTGHREDIDKLLAVHAHEQSGIVEDREARGHAAK